MKNAVWYYPRQELLTAEKIEEFLHWAKAHSITRVIVHFPNTDLWPKCSRKPEIEGLLDAMIQAGFEVHGMINTLTSPAQSLRQRDYQHLFAVDAHGHSSLFEPSGGHRWFLDPNNPVVGDIVEQTVGNLLEAYPVLAGVQLDFIRYYHNHSILTLDTRQVGHNLRQFQAPQITIQADGTEVTYYLKSKDILFNDPPIGGPQTYEHRYSYCYCPRCLEDFQAEIGSELPMDAGLAAVVADLDTEYREQWFRFRADKITDLVRRLRRRIKGKQLSATIWYHSPYGINLLGGQVDARTVYQNFGQDWPRWVDEGLVDFLCPMNYWLQPQEFSQVTADQVRLTEKRIPLYSGILYDQQYPVCAEQLSVYKDLAPRAGADGICFFSYNSWKERC